MDHRFHTAAQPLSAAQIADAIHATLWRDGTQLAAAPAGLLFEDVASLDSAGATHISFLDNTKYIPQFEKSAAGGCIIHSKHIVRAPASMLLFVCDEPYVSYATIAGVFHPPAALEPGISPHAHIHPSVQLGHGVRVDAGAVIDSNAVIGDETHISANVHVDQGVVIGKHCRIGANSTLSHCLIGEHVVIHRGVHIGQDGFGFAPGKKGVVKVPQLGRVIIDDHVEIGSGTCIDRGAAPDTVIGAHTKIDNLVQIGHNARIGRFCFLAGQVGVAGSCVVEDGVMLGGQAGLAGHLRIGAGAKIAAQSGVMGDVPAGATYVGAPAVPNRDYFRQMATLKKLTKKEDART